MTRRIRTKKHKRERRHRRVRTKVIGTAERPRLSVFRSNKEIYVQLIDDETGTTLLSSNTGMVKGSGPKERATALGEEIAKRAKAKDISEAVFDRGGFLFAGKIRDVAEGARRAGLKI